MHMNIGLIGAPGSGKDEVAKFLVEKRGFRRLAFADQIKASYFAEIGITDEEFKAARGTAIETVWRGGLWDYSSGMKYAHGDRYFIDPVLIKMEDSVEPVVISDIRTSEEFNAVKNLVQVVLVIKDFEEDFYPIDGIKETSGIALRHLLGYPVIYNSYDNLDGLHKEIERLYDILSIHGGINGSARL